MMIMKEKDDDDGYTRRVSGLDLSVVVKTALDLPPFSPLISRRQLPHFHPRHLPRHLMPA